MTRGYTIDRMLDLGIIFAVINALLLGIANYLLKKSYKDFSPAVDFFIFSIFCIFLWGGLGLWMGVDFSNPTFGLAVGIVSAVLGQLIYIYVLSKGQLSITATILSTFSVYTILFSVIFINERPSFLQLFYVGLAILGTVLVTLPEKDQLKTADLKKIKMIGLSVFAAASIGASDVLSKHYMTVTSVGSFLFYTAIAQFVVSFIYLRIEKEHLSQFATIYKRLRDYKYAIFGSLCISTSTMFLFLAFNYGMVSVVSPISASYPIITVLLAYFLLKEHLSLKNLIAIGLVIIAVLGISTVV